MDFRILGPLEVVLTDRRLELGGARQQTVLAALLLEAGRTVTVSRLTETIYDDAPPPTAKAQIQICVSALRRLFGNCGRPDIIVTQSNGYAVRIADEGFDLGRFEHLLRQAKQARAENRAEEAVAHYRDALALWRGPALEGIESRVVQAAAMRLDEDRVAANEECVDLEFDLGHHHELVGELTALVAQYPLRERLRGQLMLALYRSGRQAEALQAYNQARRVMIEELGIEPHERLQRLQHAILTSDPALNLPATAVRVSTPPPPSPPVAVPRLLPTDIADFSGRSKLVDEILERLVGSGGGPGRYAVPIVALSGKPGIGKSTMAVHVAHRVVEHYPDGQLYANLHGGSSRSVAAIRVLERFLRALGVTGSSVPEGLEERAELYRMLLADKKVLIVLDDVGTEGQVLPLLPGSPNAAVVLSSRSRLAGLSGAVHVEVDVFDSAQSLDLLSRIAGAERVQSEPAFSVALAELCGHLPLALRIAGARLAARPHWSIEQLVERLADETRRLDELKHGEMAIRASISLTYESVSGDARRLFRRLAILDCDIITAWLGSALLDRPVAEAQDLLDDLADAQLLETTGTGRGVNVHYRFHDLIRVFARERLAAEEPIAERSAALGRMLGGLLTLVDAARRKELEDRLLIPPPAWSLPEALVDRLVEHPLAWFERERSILVSGIRQAAQAGLTEVCWGLALGAATFFLSRFYLDDWREAQQLAMAAVQQAGDTAGQATMLYVNGALASNERRFDDARRDYLAAIQLFTELDDQRSLATALANLGYLHLVTGQLDAAAERCRQALDLSRRHGTPSNTSNVLCHLAQIRLLFSDPEGAEALLSDAMELAGGVSGRQKAYIQVRLGYTYLELGRSAEALRIVEAALAVYQKIGDPMGESYALICTGLAKLRLGARAEASGTLRHALLLATTTDDRLSRGRVLAALAELALAEGDSAGAVTAAEQALDLFATLGVPLDEVNALKLLRDAHRVRGDDASAVEAVARILAIAAKLGPEVAERLRVVLATPTHRAGMS
ncbi:SARP family transcriptional regulator [Microbispora cellulosiformans]|uniref:SARP family transcriptional regulator n=1 Tax=Microbispora cellulosiformans TaxID=2614688 RepID=A0A5J5JSL9_9ACTN|nr:BTAD domain-containing putative transcriptional regulator [Microbispora cellulosiformans]KAA9373792.1 SARP family transcriptional regulator [Microbispora cellulosiformans]